MSSKIYLRDKLVKSSCEFWVEIVHCASLAYLDRRWQSKQEVRCHILWIHIDLNRTNHRTFSEKTELFNCVHFRMHAHSQRTWKTHWKRVLLEDTIPKSYTKHIRQKPLNNLDLRHTSKHQANTSRHHQTNILSARTKPSPQKKNKKPYMHPQMHACNHTRWHTSTHTLVLEASYSLILVYLIGL